MLNSYIHWSLSSVERSCGKQEEQVNFVTAAGEGSRLESG